MGWRDSVRKQINRAKSRNAENKISEKINKRNKKYCEENHKKNFLMGKSLYYPSDENDYSYQ